MRVEIPFNGPAYETESRLVSAQECVNFYPREYGEDQIVLYGTPGLEVFCDLETDQAIHDMLVWENYLYAVSGGSLYQVTKSGSKSDLGSLNTAARADMATNGLDILIVLGETGFVYDLDAGTLTQITDLDFPGQSNVIQADGYYLVNKPHTGQIWRSNYNDGSQWNGLAFSTAGGDSDDIRGLIVDNRDIIILGEWSTEIWYNTGEATFNFARIDGAFIEQGMVSPFARTRVNNAVYFLGQDKRGRGQVFQMVGRSPTVISTTPIEYQISQCDVTDALMLSYQQEGHAFVVLTLPIEGKTFVYDSITKMWHMRSSRVAGVDTRWRANCHAYFDGKHLVGDYLNGKIYEVKTDVYDEDGTDLIATRTTPVIRRSQNRFTVNELQVLTEPGVGLITGDDEDIDPQGMISWSKDGGYTWSPEVMVPMGKIGEIDNRTRVTQLGQGRNWVFSFKVSAAVKRVILGAYAEIEEDE